MQFFSGFSLQNEEHFFSDILDESSYCVAGFSYGAIKALRYARKCLQEGQRIDRVQLLSPAFFQTKGEKFKQLQLRGFKRDKEQYLQAFLGLCFTPYDVQGVQTVEVTSNELEELLYYEWSVADLVELSARGVEIEVYLGGEDKIVDAQAAREFFRDCATVTYIKHANHFLQTS